MDQTPEPSPDPHAVGSGETSIEVDISAFLPDGVELAGLGDDDEIDTTLLEEIETELNEVDVALTAIDAGELAASPLLRRLLGDDLG